MFDGKKFYVTDSISNASIQGASLHPGTLSVFGNHILTNLFNITFKNLRFTL